MNAVQNSTQNYHFFSDLLRRRRWMDCHLEIWKIFGSFINWFIVEWTGVLIYIILFSFVFECKNFICFYLSMTTPAFIFLVLIFFGSAVSTCKTFRICGVSYPYIHIHTRKMTTIFSRNKRNEKKTKIFQSQMFTEGYEVNTFSAIFCLLFEMDRSFLKILFYCPKNEIVFTIYVVWLFCNIL